MDTQELLDKLRTIADEAKVDSNPREVRAVGAVLVGAMAAIKVGEAVPFMVHVTDYLTPMMSRAKTRHDAGLN